MKSLVLLLSLSLADAFSPHISPLCHTSCRLPTRLTSNETSENGLQHTSSSSSSPRKREPKSLWEVAKSIGGRVDSVGQSMKPKAKHAAVLSKAAVKKGAKIKDLLKAVFFYSVYLTYRVVRGITVVMPSVYRQLYAKFSNIVEYPFEDQIMMRDTNPATGNLKWRTRINVGLLSVVLAASYVVAGAGRVAWTFGTTARHTRSFLDSVAAAVDKQEENEVRMKRMGDRPLPRPKNYF